ncbi:MAG: glutamyl-tRNA amidotransferase [Chloroflexi bacterium RBG_16_68_14]|nr:MAG: glutamyl-tRNA amidotransferase [Chloroflexi bacterium RBG_16_68_14]
MSLKEQFAADLKDAMRQRDERRRGVLRLTLAALHNAEIEARGELDAAAVAGVLAREAKRRRESIEEFGKAGRQDLVDKEEAELAILSAYLPQPLSREEIVQAARQVIQETGASGPKDIGKVMPVLMRQLAGRADGREVNEVVRELLAGS